MNHTKTTAEPLHREIGGVKYIVARKFRENASEDAASKMVRIIRSETLRLLVDTQFSASKTAQGASKGII